MPKAPGRALARPLHITSCTTTYIGEATVRTMRRAFGIGTAAAFLVTALPSTMLEAQATQVSVGVGVGLFDGVGLGLAVDHWSGGGAYTGVSVATGVAASPAGAYGIYSQGYDAAYYGVPNYCHDVYAWIENPSYYGGHAWWLWDDGWGYGGYYRSAWYQQCILAGPMQAYHQFHAMVFFRRAHRSWYGYRSGGFIYRRDPFAHPWGPFWSYEPRWAVVGGSWGYPRGVVVHRPGTARPGRGGRSPLYGPDVGYKENPAAGAGRTAVPRRTSVGDVAGRTPGTETRRPTVRTSDGARAAPRGEREVVRARPSQERPTPAARPGATRRTAPAGGDRGGAPAARTPTTRAQPPSRSQPTARSAPARGGTPTARSRPTARTGPARGGTPTTRSTPTARTSPTGRSTPTARTTPTGRSTPTARTSPTGRAGPATRPAPTTRRSTPTARPAPATGRGPATRSAPPARSAPTARSAPVRGRTPPTARAAPSRGSTPPRATRPAPTRRSTPATRPAPRTRAPAARKAPTTRSAPPARAPARGKARAAPPKGKKRGGGGGA
jgi:hypothetical protein